MIDNFYYIMKLIGRDSAIKGRFYNGNIKEKDTLVIDNQAFNHNYLVQSESDKKKYYNVSIINNGEKILGFTCNCPQYERIRTCKHIGAVLYSKYNEIVETEIVDEIAESNSILDQYISKNKKTIKEKVNLNIEFTILYKNINIALYIGVDKKYKIAKISKLNNFLKDYIENKSHEFGKAFTYNPSKNYFDKKDEEILNYLIEIKEYLSDDYYNQNIEIDDLFLDKLLSYLKEKGFQLINNNKLTMIDNVYDGMPTKYILNEENDNYIVSPENIEEYTTFNDNIKYIIYKNNLYILDKNDEKLLSLMAKRKINKITFSKDNFNKFSSGLFGKIRNNLEINENIKDITLPVTPNTKLYFDIKQSSLLCKIIFDYGGQEINYFEKSNILRDDEYENNVFNEIVSYGFIKEKAHLVLDDDKMYEFLEYEIQKLTEKYQVYTSKQIRETKILKNLKANNNFSIGQDGIMSYSFNIEGIDQNEINDIFIALKQKKKYYKLKNNNVINLECNDEINDLKDLTDELNITKDELSLDNVEIPKYRALYIDSLKKNKYKNIKTNNIFDSFIENFIKYKNVDITLDKKDFEILRPYQKTGVKWLKTIYKCDLGGILADEMGLGKSIQTIMFIKEVLKEKQDAKIIIVVPTSLMYNWKKEFEKFAPNLKYVVVADNKNKRKEIIDKKDEYNIFITSYGLIRNDKDEYENINFEVCIVDEAQNIKNYQAEMTKEIKKIKAKCKIALTGTPLENNITELWSIFDYIMPGYLNTIYKFREKYNIKDVTNDDIKILDNLNILVKPFMLRRKKADVIKSLPPKIENKIYVDLPNKQKLLYLKALNDTKDEIKDLSSTEGFQKSKMRILQLLTVLRQICIDPSVIYDNYDGEKVKLDELLSIVKENILNNHKILIFSSFKRILDNVSKLFDSNEISYYMIDGSVKSKDRMDLVDKFNSDNTNCFLITLKSGGTGLNLTGADVVIHLDIWWNPQVENQATDRAHRIGQTKSVSVIKLITTGTIEEKIIELQEKKKILSDNIIEGKNSTESLTSLTEKEIKNLLSITE